MPASEACGAHGAVAAGNGVDAPASTDAGHARISRHSLNSTHSWTASRARHANHAEEAPRASRCMNAPPSPFPVQRKTLAGPFRPAGYARHSQAANGSCRGGSLSLYLHREYLYGFGPGLPDPSDPPGGGFYRHMPIASCFFVCRECSRHTKSPGLQSRPGWISLPSRETFKILRSMANGKFGRPKATDPRRHRYNFKLNDREQTRFRELLDAAG